MAVAELGRSIQLFTLYLFFYISIQLPMNLSHSQANLYLTIFVLQFFFRGPRYGCLTVYILLDPCFVFLFVLFYFCYLQHMQSFIILKLSILLSLSSSSSIKVVASCAQTMGMHIIGYDPVMTPDAFLEVHTFATFFPVSAYHLVV